MRPTLAVLLTLLAPGLASATDAQGYTAETVWSEDFSGTLEGYDVTERNGTLRIEDGALHMVRTAQTVGAAEARRDLPDGGPSRVGLYARVLIEEDFIGKIHLLEGYGASIFAHDGKFWYRGAPEGGSYVSMPLTDIVRGEWTTVGFCHERGASSVNVTIGGRAMGTFRPHASNSQDLLLGDKDDTSMGLGNVWWDDLQLDAPCEDPVSAPRIQPVPEPDAPPVYVDGDLEVRLLQAPSFFTPGGKSRVTFSVTNHGQTVAEPAWSFTAWEIGVTFLPDSQTVPPGSTIQVAIDLDFPESFTRDLDATFVARWNGFAPAADVRIPYIDPGTPLTVRVLQEPDYGVPGSEANVTFEVGNRAGTDLAVQLAFEAENAQWSITTQSGAVPANGTIRVRVDLRFSPDLMYDFEGTLTVISGAARAEGTVTFPVGPVPVMPSAENATDPASTPELADDATVALPETAPALPLDATPAATTAPETPDRPTSLAGVAVDAAAAHPVATAVTATGTAVGAAALLASRYDAARFALAAPAVGLFTRISRPAALDHATRDRLHDAVLAEPGVTYTALKTRFRLSTGTAVHHLRVLEEQRMVVSRREGAFRRFYPVAGKAPALDPDPLTPMQKRILDILDAGPRTQGEVAAALGITRQGANFHVKSLERGGWVRYEEGTEGWRIRRTEKPLRP